MFVQIMNKCRGFLIMARRKRKRKTVSRSKARKILRDGKIRGKKLTKRQRGFFGARAASKKRRKRRKRRR